MYCRQTIPQFVESIKDCFAILDDVDHRLNCTYDGSGQKLDYGCNYLYRNARYFLATAHYDEPGGVIGRYETDRDLRLHFQLSLDLRVRFNPKVCCSDLPRMVRETVIFSAEVHNRS